MSKITYDKSHTLHGSPVEIKYETKYPGNAWNHIGTVSTKITIWKLNQEDIDYLNKNGHTQYPREHIDLMISNDNLWSFETAHFKEIVKLLEIQI